MIRHGKQTTLSRREVLRLAFTGAAGMVIGTLMSGCSDALPRHTDEEPKPTQAQPTSTASKVLVEPQKTPTLSASTGSRILLVYFSRAGENYYYGGRTQPGRILHRLLAMNGSASLLP